MTTFDPKKFETPEEFVAAWARDAVGCVCSTIAKFARPDRAPCVVCRARSIVRGEAPGTLGESLARREDRAREIDAKIASWRARRRP